MIEGRQAPNWVLVSLALMALLAWLSLDAVTVAANRIVPGIPQAALTVMGGWPALLLALPLLAVVVLAWRPDRRSLWLALAAVMAVLLLLPFWLSAAASTLVSPDLPQARIGIGTSFWLLNFLLLLAMIELRTASGCRGHKAGCCCFPWCWPGGWRCPYGLSRWR